MNVISFIGPDGSGKSSIIQGFYKFYNDSDVYHLKFGKFREVGSKSSPSTVRQYGAFLSVLKLIYLIVESHLRPLIFRTRLVILDRNVLEICVDPVRFGYNGPKCFLKMALRLIYKPNFLFVIVSTPEKYVERKNEISLERGRYLNEEYLKLARLTAATIVENNGTVEEAVEIIVNEIKVAQ